MPQRIFEVGPVIKDFKEQEHLASLSIHATANFAEVKSVVDAVLKELGHGNGDRDGAVEVVESADDAFLAGRRADIIIDSHKKGVFGEIHPQVLLNFGLDYPVVGFELDVY